MTESRRFAVDLEQLVLRHLAAVSGTAATLPDLVAALLPRLLPESGDPANARYFANFPIAAVVDAAVRRGALRCESLAGINHYRIN